MPPNGSADALWERHREGILRHISGKLGSEGAALAPDILQEVALAAHRHDFERAPVDDPLNWLRRIASNKIADHWRKTLRGREADTQWLAEREAEPLRCPSEWVLHQSRREAVQEGLALISEDERRLLREKYLMGRTTAEIARRDGVGEKVIEHRLATARASFREIMSREL